VGEYGVRRSTTALCMHHVIRVVGFESPPYSLKEGEKRMSVIKGVANIDLAEYMTIITLLILVVGFAIAGFCSGHSCWR
jgi:hypothetical protein